MAEIDCDLLISLVETRPAIWDKTCNMYKDKTSRTSAWRDICTIFKPDFNELEQKEKSDYAKLILKKWTNLRDCWRKSVSLHNDRKKSGSGKKSSKLYIYHEQLKFLTKNSGFSIAHESISEETERENEQATDEEQRNTEHVKGINDSENIVSTPISATISDKKRKITKTNEVDAKKIKFIDHQIKSLEQPKKEDDNRHLLFFKGLLPSLECLNDDQTLEFQSGVISLLQSIKKSNAASKPV